MEFFVMYVPEGLFFCGLFLYFFLLTNFIFWDISLVEWKISSLRNRCQPSCRLQMDPTIKTGIEGIRQIVDGAILLLFAQFLIESGSWRRSHFVWSIIKDFFLPFSFLLENQCRLLHCLDFLIGVNFQSLKYFEKLMFIWVSGCFQWKTLKRSEIHEFNLVSHKLHIISVTFDAFDSIQYSLFKYYIHSRILLQSLILCNWVGFMTNSKS